MWGNSRPGNAVGGYLISTVSYHSFQATNDKIIKDNLLKEIKVGGFTDFPKLDFGGLLIYVLTYRFTVLEEQRNAKKRTFMWVQAFNYLKRNYKNLLYPNI
jgi:hypothetical protein